jgi:hypothetical protein
MSTAALCGYAGSISGPAGATECTNWEVTLNVDAQDATSMDSAGWKVKIACLKGANGTFRTVGGSSTVGKHTNCSFQDAPTGGVSVDGDIVISKINISTPVDGIVSFVHDFNFTGDITCSLMP